MFFVCLDLTSLICKIISCDTIVNIVAFFNALSVVTDWKSTKHFITTQVYKKL